MVLKLTLKPGERILINGAEISTGDAAGDFAIHNHARILRENEFLSVEQLRNALASPEEFDAPETWLYYLLQMIYLQPEHSQLNMAKLPDAIRDTVNAAPDKEDAIKKVHLLVNEGEIFLAMREMREVFPDCLTFDGK